MSIEFNCPYCTATVRVADAAAGKVGRCPKCETRLRVPNVGPFATTEAAPPTPPQPAASHPSTTDDRQTDTPAFDPDETQIFRKETAENSTSPAQSEPAPQFPSQGAPATPLNTATGPASDVLPDFNFADPKPATPASTPGQLPLVPPDADPITSRYLKRKKKNKFDYGKLIGPGLFGTLLVIIAVTYYVWSLPSFLGQLPGERLSPNQSIQVPLRGSLFDIDQKAFQRIVDDVRQSPIELRSELVILRMQTAADGLQLSLQPGGGADLIRVQVQTLAPVNKHYRNHYDRLDDARLLEIQNALVSLGHDWLKAPEDGKTQMFPNYRHSLIYNAFVKGLGRICYARVGNAMYPCVHENLDGVLYFVVPKGTKEFAILERQEVPETPFFPSQFRIDVVVGLPEMDAPTVVPLNDVPTVEPELSDEERMERAAQATGTYDLTD